MAQISWTKDQKEAITQKEANILVAAAAGSGKTAVLVERMIQKIIKDQIDIDSILVVTFTNAAASEMRQKILDAIYQKMDEEPENVHLQRQLNLLSKAHICTIHSFCLDVIRNHFYEIDISPTFRIADSSEIELLKQEVLDEMLEEKYFKEEKEFMKLLDIYTGYRGDEPLKDLILGIYRYIQSSPFPEEWLEEKTNMFYKADIKEDFGNTVWGKVLLQDFKDSIVEAKLGLIKVKELLDTNPELDKFSANIRRELEKLELLEKSCVSWDEAYSSAQQFTFEKWPIDRKITSNIKEEAKQIRDKIIKTLKDKKDKTFIYSSEEANQDIMDMYDILKYIKKYILEFSQAFTNKKREKNIVDFNDIEHLALKILVKKDEEGKYLPTKVAKEYMEKFTEIAIDEYQDSNLVQEYILTTISKGNNIFMVGDVKQSIYRFRQARPELFLEKYDTYPLKEERKDENTLKIQLFKNFRSRSNILDLTNLVFKDIMSKSLGDISYDEKEYLNLGANYEETDSNILYAGKAQLHMIDLKEKEDEQEDFEESKERVEDTVLEARFVANHIQKMIKENYQVFDKKTGYRKMQYKDIVILLRATSQAAPIYEKELVDLGMPVFSDSSATYLDSVEIQTIMSLLKIIDNPIQDIPFVTVLRSMIGGFTDNDLVEIRLADKYTSFYECMLKARLQVNPKLSKKIDSFLDNLERWTKQKEYLSLEELIWQIYTDTNYDNYVELMPGGAVRKANLRMLFEKAKEYEKTSFKGLYQFIRFVDKLKLSSGDMGAAKIIGENEDVIRIMSIHKSKGLEFPVVFLCGTGKRFNMQDLNDTIILHQDMGFGPKYIDYEKRIEYDTLAKEAMKKKIRKETLSEEMRILYVALTRAKEKLIITGVCKDLEKSLSQTEDYLALYDVNKEKLDSRLVAKGKSYLDWIQMTILAHKQDIDSLIEVNKYQKEELIRKWKNEDIYEEEKESVDKILEKLDNYSLDCNMKKKLEDKMEWVYPYLEDTNMPGKVSVTQIKEKKIEDNEKQTEELEVELDKPKFMKDQKITNAQKGTLVHLCMQKLDVKEEYTMEKIELLIEELVAKQFVTRLEADSISKRKLYEFTKSNIWAQMKDAKVLEREKPFYIQIPSCEIYEENTNQKILAQGIIDLYYITKEDKLVLVDYKTDYVSDESGVELKEKYIEQLKIYKRALESALDRRVDQIYLYSTYLEKEISINIE